MACAVVAGGAAALHYDHERKAKGISVFVEVDGLRNTIVLDDELVRLQGVDDLSVLGLDGGRDQHDVRLRPERVALVVSRRDWSRSGWVYRRGCGRILRHGGSAEEQDGEEEPHGSSLTGGVLGGVN